jgi:hypothetical protein
MPCRYVTRSLTKTPARADGNLMSIATSRGILSAALDRLFSVPLNRQIANSFLIILVLTRARPQIYMRYKKDPTLHHDRAADAGASDQNGCSDRTHG